MKELLFVDHFRNFIEFKSEVYTNWEGDSSSEFTRAPSDRTLRRIAKRHAGQGVQLHIDALDASEPLPGNIPSRN
jgi:hypothetical protein